MNSDGDIQPPPFMNSDTPSQAGEAVPPIISREKPIVTSLGAHPARKRASGLFWILLLLLVTAFAGFLLLGGFFGFGGY